MGIDFGGHGCIRCGIRLISEISEMESLFLLQFYQKQMIDFVDADEMRENIRNLIDKNDFKL